MSDVTPKLLDLTRDLAAAEAFGTSRAEVDRLLSDALGTLHGVVNYDLATIFELDGDALRVRVATGRLAGAAVVGHALDLREWPSLREVLNVGEAHAFLEHDHADGDGDPFDGVLDLPHGHACMVVPLRAGDDVLGVMTFDREQCEVYPEDVVQLAGVYGTMLAVALRYGEQSARLSRLREQLAEHNRVLSERVGDGNDACAMIDASRSPAMRQVAELARQVAVTDTPVLIQGETGTGKEVVAQAIHGWSRRADRPMVTLNCAALPATLIESELFGHVKGAFSGATASRIGRFGAANGGTLMLDEIGELPLELQAKLLRVLQEGTYEPVGSDRSVRVDVRILAATHVDLLAAVRAGTFREDLYYRLAVFPIQVPPLRARVEDIPVIAENFLAGLARRSGRGPWHLDADAMAELQQRPWQGNVRELVNTLERATILANSPELSLEPTTSAAAPRADDGAPATLEDLERSHIDRVLRLTNGRLYGEGGAAEILGINPNTLRSRMKKLGLGGARAYRD